MSKIKDIKQIQHWLTSLIPNIDADTIRKIESDASSRKYYRIESPEKTYILMDCDADNAMINFIRINKLFTNNSVNVPKIYRVDIENGLMLLEDFGDQTYLSILNKENSNGLYFDAMNSLICIQKISMNGNFALNQMDKEYVHDKLNIFQEWYLTKHLNIIPSKFEHFIEKITPILTQAFINSPKTLVHLDFHSKNLMYTSTSQPGVLDFQDAMIGPFIYDLASLLNDAYIVWPRPLIEKWIKMYSDLAVKNNIISESDAYKVMSFFDIISLQRNIKNLGVFARLHIMYNKSGYLKFIPNLIDYIVEISKRYDELSFVNDFFQSITTEGNNFNHVDTGD